MGFVARLFASCSGFYLAGSLTVSLAIGGTVLMVRKVAIGLSGWSLLNKLMSFLRYWTAEGGSQVFSFSGYSFQDTR